LRSCTVNPPVDEYGFGQDCNLDDIELDGDEWQRRQADGETEQQLQERWARTGTNNTYSEYIAQQQQVQSQPVLARSWAKRLTQTQTRQPIQQLQPTSNTYQQDLLDDIGLEGGSGDDEPLNNGFHYPDNGHNGQAIGNTNHAAHVDSDFDTMLKNITAQCQQDCANLKIQFETSNANAAAAIGAINDIQKAMGAQVQANTGTLNKLCEQYTSLNATVSNMSADIRRILEKMGDVDGGPSKQPRTDASTSATNTDTSSSQNT